MHLKLSKNNILSNEFFRLYIDITNGLIYQHRKARWFFCASTSKLYLITYRLIVVIRRNRLHG